MNILDIIREYEDKLLLRIARLETQVKELTSEKEKLEEKIDDQHKGLTDLLLGRNLKPVGLEFHDGIIQRSFQEDLRMLVVFTLEERQRGQKSCDDSGRRIPYIVPEGRVHMMLDKAAGFPNVGDSIMPTLEDAHTYIDKRKVWVNALLVVLKKIM